MIPNDRSSVRVTHIITRWSLSRPWRHRVHATDVSTVIGTPSSPPATGKTALLRDLIRQQRPGAPPRR